MSQEEWNNQQYNTVENYQDPIAASDGKKPARKPGRGIISGSTIAAIVLVNLFGMVGGLICYAGFWGIYAICRSRLHLAAKIILSIVIVFAVLALLFVFYIGVAIATQVG